MKLYPVFLPLFLTLLVSAAACQQETPPEPKSESETETEINLESRLIFENATLEQANSEGETLWKISAKKAVYSKDKKTAKLEELTGNIFQDGELVLQVKAKRGKIYRDGEAVFLEDEIVATDPRNGVVITGEEVEWQPKEEILIVRKNLTGSHAKLTAAAKEGRYYSREERLELMGNIVATALEPKVQLKTEHLLWEIVAKKVIADSPLEIVRYKENDIITDEVVAEKGEVDLANTRARLAENVELKSLDPVVQIATNLVIWNYGDRIIKTEQPVQIVDSQAQVTVTGNGGKVDLVGEIAHLQGGVKGISTKNQARLYADELIWNIPTQMVEAVGNVIYSQVDPELNLTGVKAVGKLQENRVVVTGNDHNRVVTEIIPE